MAALSSIELFERVLLGEVIARSDVEAMLTAHVEEDLHVDYKSGKLLAKKNDNKRKLRKAVSGFANAEGGVLVLGANGGDVDPPEDRWRVKACPTKVGGTSGVDWVKGIIHGLLNLRPQPKVVPLDGGKLILVGVQRSELLVPCTEPGKGIVYYLRMYDSTQEVPAYLLADLMLGRRQRPGFDVSLRSVRVRAIGIGKRVKERAEPGAYWAEPWPIHVRVEVANTGLVWADDVRCGLVGFELRENAVLPDSVRSAVAIRSAGESFCAAQVVCGLGELTPFQARLSDTMQLLIPSVEPLQRAREEEVARLSKDQFEATRQYLGTRYVETSVRATWWGALYVICRDAPPQWFQVCVPFNEHAGVDYERLLAEPATETPVVGVTYEYLPPNEDDWVAVVGGGADPLRRITHDDAGARIAVDVTHARDG